jgi:hypothetical protein
MCTFCCDPKKIEESDRVNCVSIRANSYIDVATKRDALVRVVSGTHYQGTRIVIQPVKSADSGDIPCSYSMPGRAGGFIPGAGAWRIYNQGGGAIKVAILDLYCGIAFHAFAVQGYGRPVHSSPSIGTANAAILAANEQAGYRLIQNPSTASESVFVSFGAAAVLNEGVEIVPGGSYEMEGGNMWRGVVNGIRSTTTADVLVTEGD